jgi:hypothetical protein
MGGNDCLATLHSSDRQQLEFKDTKIRLDLRMTAKGYKNSLIESWSRVNNPELKI